MSALIQAFICPSRSAPAPSSVTLCNYCGTTLFIAHAAEIILPAIADAQQVITEMRGHLNAQAYDSEVSCKLGLACFTLKLYDQTERAFEQAELRGNPNQLHRVIQEFQGPFS